MAQTTDLDTAVFGADALPAHREELLAVYRDAYADKIANPFFTEGRYWERLEAYASRDGFALAEGRLGGELVGYALGYHLPNGSAWWRGLISEVEPDLITEDGERTFALNYVMVRQSFRRRGFAKALHDTLLNQRPEKRATLLVSPDNVPARSAYLSWGWYKIGDLQPFEDAPIYEAMLFNLQ